MALKKSELYSSLWSSCDELRGGMDASGSKDYVLVLLFIKYVSDKYAGQPYAPITIPKGASFKDMVALKGNPCRLLLAVHDTSSLIVMPNSGMIMPILGATRSRRSTRKSLADALFTKTQQRVLGVLFGQPERSFYASELIRDAGTGSGAAQRELARLEGKRADLGATDWPSEALPGHAVSPLYSELRNIVLKTVGLAEPLRDALKPLS